MTLRSEMPDSPPSQSQGQGQGVIVAETMDLERYPWKCKDKEWEQEWHEPLEWEK